MINSNKMNLGQLLLRQGVLDEDQLAHAMAEHKRTGLMLSKILVRLGMVSEETLTNILGSQMQSSTKMRIGEMLLAQGYITQEQLDKALETQKTSGKRLGRTLVDLGYMPEERLIEILSRQFEVPYVKLDNFNIDPNAYTYLPEDMCKQYRVVPLFVQKGEDERRQVRSVMTIAMTDPTNMRTISIVKFKVRMDVDIVMASDADVAKAIERVFAGHGPTEESLAELISESKDGEELETVERGQGGNDEPELSDEEGRQVVKIVTTLIHEAIARKASDIHLEPQETFLKLRYRIDGDLQVMSPIPARLMPQILSRIKLLSKMDIAEKRKPLDGRFTVRYKGAEVDLRVSSFPISLRKRGVCEKIVMRILNPNSGQFPLKDMGFDPRVLKQFIDAINAPNGIVLVTGPTGSGKSTTLYASIREILDSTINISTMEDPVELNIDGVNQGQINNAAGFTFAAGIRALLRQDPDVIMVGEMRDRESFESALQAADTGHLVLSTLHATNASQAIARILDFYPRQEQDALRKSLALNLQAVIAQRLLPRISSGLIPAVEIMINTPNVRKLIQKNEMDRLPDAIAAGKEDGMISFNASLLNLINGGEITEEVGLEASEEPDVLRMNLKGIFVGTGSSILGE